MVDKPAGLLTIATRRERERTLYAQLRDRAQARRPPERVFIVHRLDRDASGLLVLAKTPEAKRALQAQFHDRSAGRLYLAVVEGRVAEDDFTLRAHLAENAALRVFDTGDPRRGRLAVTHVRVVRRASARTMIEVRLETGRKHQIRVQLAGIGHPLVGDRRYGTKTPGARLMLHAARLRLTHPDSGAALEFRSALPAALRAALVAAG